MGGEWFLERAQAERAERLAAPPLDLVVWPDFRAPADGNAQVQPEYPHSFLNSLEPPYPVRRVHDVIRE